MKRTEIKLGTKVRIIGTLKDSPVYKVEKWITSFVVALTYKTETGKTVSGGQVDISLLIPANDSRFVGMGTMDNKLQIGQELYLSTGHKVYLIAVGRNSKILWVGCKKSITNIQRDGIPFSYAGKRMVRNYWLDSNPRWGRFVDGTNPYIEDDDKSAPTLLLSGSNGYNKMIQKQTRKEVKVCHVVGIRKLWFE